MEKARDSRLIVYWLCGTIQVKRGPDDGERDLPGEVVATKTFAGRRTVPLVPELAARLARRS